MHQQEIEMAEDPFYRVPAPQLRELHKLWRWQHLCDEVRQARERFFRQSRDSPPGQRGRKDGVTPVSPKTGRSE